MHQRVAIATEHLDPVGWQISAQKGAVSRRVRAECEMAGLEFPGNWEVLLECSPCALIEFLDLKIGIRRLRPDIPVLGSAGTVVATNLRDLRALILDPEFDLAGDIVAPNLCDLWYRIFDSERHAPLVSDCPG